ncbi:MAG: hypothetical protein KF901_04030 [Myxococcales bacterium]|nr:hypothetical protein [Myxococcales bacterium]
MRPRRIGPSPFLPAALVVAGLLAACGDDGICDAEALQEALDRASAGAVVRVGPCRVEGATLRVPERVALEGVAGSELVGDEAVVTLAAGAALRSLRVVVDAGHGVRALGAGARVEDVEISVRRGVGLAVRADDVVVSRVRVVGVDDPASFPPLAEPTESAIGLAVLDARDVSIVELDAVQVGPWGAIVANSTLVWRGGSVRELVGTAIYVEASEATLEGLVIDDVRPGRQLLPAYGLVAVGDARLETSDVEISAADLGLLHHESHGAHRDLVVRGHRFGGAWIQRSSDVTWTGGRADENGAVGVASVASADVRLEGVEVARTVLRTTLLGEAGAVEMGDGVQVLDPSGPNVLRGVSLVDHPRIGVLLSVGALGVAGLTRVSLEAVEVTASASEALGCLAQSDAELLPLGGWDDDVARAPALVTNDAARVGLLTIGGGIADGSLPALRLEL